MQTDVAFHLTLFFVIRFFKYGDFSDDQCVETTVGYDGIGGAVCGGVGGVGGVGARGGVIVNGCGCGLLTTVVFVSTTVYSLY